MFKHMTIFLAAAIIIGGSICTARAADPPPPTTSLIVKLVDGLTPDQQAAVILRDGGVETSSIPALRLHIVAVPTDQVQAILPVYQADPQVTSVEIDQTRQAEGTPSDPFYTSQWALPKIGWDALFGTAIPLSSATVAILDTGVEAAHPDLAGHVVAGTSILDGSNGQTDPNGHGTWLSGIVAAVTDNAAGIAGIGYAGVRIMPVTVLGPDGTGQDSDVIKGVLWATDQGADVILMAFSNPGFSQNLQDAIDYAWSKGVILVAATGNQGMSDPTFPAGDRGVIGVSATDWDDLLTVDSNYGQDVFLAAPGITIYTTGLGNTYLPITGTSASAAIVAGVVGVMKASADPLADPPVTNGVIVGRLARNADPAGTQEQTGNGRVNMPRALADTTTDTIEPAGAAPVGDGGPFVGPYVVAAKSLTINFSVTGGAGGTISFSNLNPSTSVADCTATCTRTGLDNNQQGTMTATPNAGSIFVGWSGTWDDGPQHNGTTTCTGTTSPCTFDMGNSSQTLTATFSMLLDQTITFDPLANKTYGDADFSVSATASSGLAVSFTASGDCTVAGSTVHITGAGSCTITAHQPGNGTYNAASDVDQSFIIDQADANITVTPYHVTYDGNAHTATGSASGVESPTPVDLTSLLHLGGTTHTTAGDYPTDGWTFDGNTNYKATSGTVHDIIDQAPLTVTADNKSRLFCEPNPSFTATYSGFVPGEGPGDLTGTLTCGTTATEGSPAGNYPITCMGQSSTNYDIHYQDGTLTVDPLGFVGFLPPIGGADATGGSFADPVRSFKLGSTIPVKFQASCGASAYLTGIHTLKAVKWTSAVAPSEDDIIDATPTDAATTGNQFRLTDSEWHFNLSTKSGFSQGIWQLIATLADGTTHSVFITIKK
jgi:hypothetical protein